MNKNREFSFSSHKSLMSYIMQTSVYISYAIMNVYVFALIQIKGKAILVFLYDMDINIDRKIEKNIAIKAIILQLVLTLIISISFYLSIIIYFGFHNQTLKNLIHLMENIIISSNFFSLLSMMAYFCYVIQQYLSDMKKEFTSITQLPIIFKKLLVIQNNVKKFNKFYNKYLFCMISLLSLECTNNLTTLYYDRFVTMAYPIPGIFESLVQIFIYCYLSDKIDKTYGSIINKYERLQMRMLDTELGQFNHCLVIRLYSLRSDMCFTAFNLYPINIKTFISILSLIMTFTVIFIETR